jgi:hypothetical protein
MFATFETWITDVRMRFWTELHEEIGVLLHVRRLRTTGVRVRGRFGVHMTGQRCAQWAMCAY